MLRKAVTDETAARNPLPLPLSLPTESRDFGSCFGKPNSSRERQEIGCDCSLQATIRLVDKIFSKNWHYVAKNRGYRPSSYKLISHR